jgi:hypothetical protein
LVGGFFDPDTDLDPDADKAGILILTAASKMDSRLSLVDQEGIIVVAYKTQDVVFF